MSFYQSAAWRELRRTVIRARPGCATPGCVGKSSHVDHIIPRRQGGASLDPANVQPLCHRCHSTKTARFDGGFGRTSVSGAAPVRAAGCDASGRPFDPGHHWHAGKP